MADDLIHKVNFDIIRYASCWEDADILLQGLWPIEGSKILSVGSAGDNSFSMLTANPEIVVAIDVNRIQLHLIELKKAVFKILNYEEALQFLGFKHCEKRTELFQCIKAELSAEASSYWQNNTFVIESGVIYAGKFEKYFRMFSRRILPFIHSKKTVAKVFSPKTKTEQERFYNSTWNSWKWRLLFKFFFSRFVLGRYGRDPEFMKEVTVPVSQTIYAKAAMHLTSQEAQTNYMLHFCLNGDFGELLPHYLQPENFVIIKANADRLVIKRGFAQDAISEFGKFDAMNLSNIFEYMDEKTFTSTAEALVNGMEQNGRLAYWNLMVPRRVSQIFPEKAEHEKNLSAALGKIDKGFFYNEFIIDRIK